VGAGALDVAGSEGEVVTVGPPSAGGRELPADVDDGDAVAGADDEDDADDGSTETPEATEVGAAAAGEPASVPPLGVRESPTVTRPPLAGPEPSGAGESEPPAMTAITATAPATPSAPATAATRRRPPALRSARRRAARPSPGATGSVSRGSSLVFS
jgi:hypothetical protein